jgi:hypothetical protein
MSWRGLWLCSAIFAVFAAAYQVAGIEPSRAAQLLFSYGPPAFVAVWVDADARRRRSPCWDLGTFVFFAWPLAVPAYCYWSRGRDGWRASTGLVAAVLAPSVIGGVLLAVYGMLGV